MQKSEKISFRGLMNINKDIYVSEGEATKMFTNILNAFDIDNKYIKKDEDCNKKYQINNNNKDIEFIKNSILNKYSETNMKEIRRQQFNKVDIKYIENLLQGLSSILSNTIEDRNRVNDQIKKMYEKTRINVRKKSVEIEIIINNILKEIKGFYSDDLIHLQSDENILYELEILKNNCKYNYNQLMKIQSSLFQKDNNEAINMVREINKKSREEKYAAEYNKVIFKSIKTIDYVLHNNEEYKKLNLKLNELYDKREFLVKIDSKNKEIFELRETIETEIQNMDDKNLEKLIKKASDIKNCLK